MEKDSLLWKELKEKFIQDLNSTERCFFLKKAKEVMMVRGYPACEDLYHYCYFLTMKERIRNIHAQGGSGLLRFIIVEGIKEVEEAIKLYQDKLEKKKLNISEIKDYNFLEFFSK